MQLVIPGLTRNPVFSWIPAFAGMTGYVTIYDAEYSDFSSSVFSLTLLAGLIQVP
jgi:hypothetical protein